MSVTLEQARRSENRICEDWLLFANDRARILRQQRDDMLTPSSSVSDGMPGAPGHISNPTMNTALAVASLPLDEAEAWLDLVRLVEIGLPTHLQVFLDLRRQTRDCRGNKGWVAFVQSRYPMEMEKATGKPASEHFVAHRSTFTEWSNHIVEITARLAIRKRLL